MKAFILAAGFGTRMGELTADRPKPMLPVGGYPMLLYALFRVLRWGLDEAIINLHYRAGAIEEALRDFPHFPIRFSHEKDILGTAGGIARVCGTLLDRDETILVLNPDTVLIPDPDDRPPASLDPEADSLLYLAPKEPGKQEMGFRFTTGTDRIAMDPTAEYFYIGVGLLRMSLLANVEPDVACGLGPFWQQASLAGRLRGRQFLGKHFDCGTREAYLAVKDRDLIPAYEKDKWHNFISWRTW
ncbi:MAG: NTP transferase domain-containing protein [Spirochaetales bacterium]|nr:NTP transferase domain-containing protein [Leptospiraceae bacterium]MCP5483156.1 NTP transferase domain-containing protein [Spirochaetales bacterium]MCP5484596.1 NTP transferase domain-containing protein [Spirochaetales bacterium]